MKLVVEMDDESLHAMDVLRGERIREAFAAQLLREGLRAVRWRQIMSAAGSTTDTGHVWDPDPAKWVHDSRREGPRRVG